MKPTYCIFDFYTKEGDFVELYHDLDRAVAAQVKWCRENWDQPIPAPEENKQLLETWDSPNGHVDLHQVSFSDDPPQCVVEVYGGVAHVTSCPPGMEITIIDHDNLETERTEVYHA